VVWVLRHAKAAPHGPDDHLRPLTGKGRRQSAEVARLLEDAAPAPTPELVLSSSAARARQTAELVLPALGERTELVVDGRLYQADPDDVIELLRAQPDDVRSVMVVGHNPTMHEVALELVGTADAAGRERLEQGFPTAALAVVRLPASSWAQLSPGTGELVELFTPGRANERGRGG
jgi:phosphohistidine phosphatase